MNKLLSSIILLFFCNLAVAGEDGKLNLNNNKKNGYEEVNDCFEKINRGVFAFNQVLDKATKQIVQSALKSGVTVRGPVPLPNVIERVTVNRSTNIDKKSREQFQKTSHARLIIIESSPQVVEALKKLDIASGVDIKIEMGETL